MPFCNMVRVFIVICITCILIAFVGGPIVYADERLDFLPYPYGIYPPPKISEVLDKEFGYEEYDGRHREYVVGVPFDIDLDGKMELVVAFAAPTACGSAGCSSLVLQGSNTKGWKILTRLSTSGDRVIVSKDTVNGYRVLIEREAILVWNGVNFFAVCLTQECRRILKQGVRH